MKSGICVNYSLVTVQFSKQFFFSLNWDLETENTFAQWRTTISKSSGRCAMFCHAKEKNNSIGDNPGFLGILFIKFRSPIPDFVFRHHTKSAKCVNIATYPPKFIGVVHFESLFHGRSACVHLSIWVLRTYRYGATFFQIRSPQNTYTHTSRMFFPQE